MNNKLRSTGTIFAGIFFLSYIVRLVLAALRGDKLLSTAIEPNGLILLVVVILFLTSALVTKLRWIQPAIFLLLSPLAIGPDTRNVYGLGFFVMGCLLVERGGYLQSKKALKIILLGSYLVVMEVAAVVISKFNVADAVAPSFFIIAFGFFLWILYKDRLVVYMKEPNPKLSLSAKGLSPAECLYVKALAGGRTIKEIAFDYEITESTVRNTLARAYKKLDVDDKSGIAGLAGKYEIVD